MYIGLFYFCALGYLFFLPLIMSRISHSPNICKMNGIILLENQSGPNEWYLYNETLIEKVWIKKKAIFEALRIIFF